MKIYLMHQTHTDIGYTDRQEKITRYHVDYLKQVITLSESIDKGGSPHEGFVWTNENHWLIETFLKNTDASWEKRLVNAIKQGYIELANNYLNLTDLVDADVLKKYLNRAKIFGEKHHVRTDSAVSMDINGWSFGYSQLMYDAGIRNFYTCIHNHHGFVPFRRKHLLFNWETPNGDTLLVWHGDVYNQGNVAKLMPDVIGVVKDGQLKTKPIIDNERLAYAKKWLDDFIESVRVQGYDYDFLPVITKGLLVDNAPPNPHIIAAIKAFNARYGNDIEIELVGINTFFDKIRAMDLDIPTYRGDWTDWWSDGFASTPKSLMSYREAQRNYHKLKHLKASDHKIDAEKFDALEYNLMMYAEHTWGYFTSVSEPWNKMTTKLETRNEMFAYQANQIADTLLDDIQAQLGEMSKAAGRPMRYKITNPYPHAISEIVKLHINWWEEFLIKDGYMVTEAGKTTPLLYQEIRVDDQARRQVNVPIELAAGTSKILVITPSKTLKRAMPLDPLATRDTVQDYPSPYIDETKKLFASRFHLESPYFKLTFAREKGIVDVFDKRLNQSLVRTDAVHLPFTPIYETTDVKAMPLYESEPMKDVRRAFGRNRKTIATRQHAGVLEDVRVLNVGPLLARVQLKYRLEGTIYTVVEVTVHADTPQIDVSLILGKDTVWAPESLYLSLPFTTGEKETLWIDKTHTPIRPRIDQLPGTLTQFYTTQSGYLLNGTKTGLAVSMPDTPLIHLGSLEPGMIQLHGDEGLKNTDFQYAWIMNNYWETNFATNLGGFYRFDYHLRRLDSNDATKGLHALRKLSESALVYQVGADA